MAKDVLEVLDPVAESIVTDAQAADRPPTLQGKVVGLWWNLKAGGDHALDRVAENLADKYQGVKFLRIYENYPAPATAIEQAARDCDAVVGTSAD